MNISLIDWGNDAAEHDKDLLEYFVEPSDFYRLENLKKTFIIGRKGSGKSAIRRKLQKIFNKDRVFLVETLPSQIDRKLQMINNPRAYQEDTFKYMWILFLYQRALIEIAKSWKGKVALGSFEYARNYAQQAGECDLDFVELLAQFLYKFRIKSHNWEFNFLSGREIKNTIDEYEFHLKNICNQEYKIIFTVDDLDLIWDNTPSSNYLLLGFLHAIQRIQSISSGNIHVFAFLREDIYNTMMSMTQHSDKFRDIMRIQWNINTLKTILVERIKFNNKKQGGANLADPFREVFPPKVGTSNTMNWLFERTLCRPRELIQLCRCYTELVTTNKPDAEVLKNAEAVYSQWKLDDLCTEYSNRYPELSKLFHYWKVYCPYSRYILKKEEYEENFMNILADLHIEQPWYKDLQNSIDAQSFMEILYEIGFVGDYIKPKKCGVNGHKTIYSISESSKNHNPQFDFVSIHPCFRKAMESTKTKKTFKTRNHSSVAPPG